MRSPTFPPIRMNAADTSASRAIADWTPLVVVSRSRTTAAIDTFISDVSTTSTNIAIARGSPAAASASASARPGRMTSSREDEGALLDDGPDTAAAVAHRTSLRR